MPLWIKHLFFLVILTYSITGWGQFAIHGDLYVSSRNELHIAFEDTYFNGGQIITAKDMDTEGIVSFGVKSEWHQLEENSFIDGWVRTYHKGWFTFPVGEGLIFSPISLNLLQVDDFVQVKYQRIPPYTLADASSSYKTPQLHYWSWKTDGEAIARIKTYWWEKHKLNHLTFNQLKPSDLLFGLYQDQGWQIVQGHFSSNPFIPENELSIKQGSGQLLEAVNLKSFKGISFSVFQEPIGINEKIVSQVITPNNDGINDTWKISGYLFSSKSYIKVYNLDGSLVFEHQGEYNNDWEGTDIFSGERLPEGSYFYRIDLNGNQSIELEGWFLIKYK